MPALWGNLLSNAAQSYNTYNTQQEDENYQRQLQAQTLAANQLANQSKALEIQQQQAAVASDQAQTADLTQAAQDANAPQAAPYSAGNQLAASAPVAGGAPQGASNGLSAPVNASNSGNGPMTAPTGGLPSTQNGLPNGKPLTPFQHAVMQTESNGQAAATSTRGASGTMQVMPATAANPGYGVVPARDNSPAEMQRVGADYATAMQQRYGNTTDAAIAYNMGPARTDAWIANGRKPNELPAETQNYVKQVVGGLQQQQQQGQQRQQQGQTQQALQAPTPADNIDIRENAGVDTPVTAYHQAVSSQGKLIQVYRIAAQDALKKGDVRNATALNAKADAMQTQQDDLAGKALTEQEKANDAVVKAFNGVHDQQSYQAAMNTIRMNPSMQAAFKGLNPSGDWNTDRNMVQSVAMRAETLADQQKNQIANQRLDLDRQKEAREQQKEEAPKLAAAQAQQQAQAQDATRRQAAAQKGIPFAPSLAATAPPGTPPVVTEKAQQQINAANQKWDTAQATSAPADINVRDIAARSYVAVREDPSLVGDLAVGPKGEIVKKGFWSGALSAKQQEIVKDGQIMVTEMQKAAPPGAQRSAATAAMAARYEQTKPNIVQSPEAFKTVAHDLYVSKAGQVAMNTWMDDWRSTNPDAPVESGLRLWRTYERDVGGPTQVYDPKTKTMVPNMSTIPTLEDGTPNSAYISPNEYFAHGGTVQGSNK